MEIVSNSSHGVLHYALLLVLYYARDSFNVDLHVMYDLQGHNQKGFYLSGDRCMNRIFFLKIQININLVLTKYN